MFSISIHVKTCAKAAIGLAVIASAACLNTARKPDSAQEPAVFYTVMGEIALSRGDARVAALQYAAAAATNADPGLIERAADVAQQTLQPSVAEGVAARWISVDPNSLDAQRAAAKAALELHKIDQSAAHYRVVLMRSPRGADAEFASLEAEFGAADDLFGARQLADQLAKMFPASAAALRLQGFAALRADDPAAAVRSFNAALALSAAPAGAGLRQTGKGTAATTDGPQENSADLSDPGDGRNDMEQALLRARVLSGDIEGPLAAARAGMQREATPENTLDYVLLLLAAHQSAAALEQLEILARQPESAPVALHLQGVIDFQEGRLDAAGLRFARLVAMGKFLDDSYYYLGLIAERHEDLERALRLYAQVQSGDNNVAALLRAAGILHAHGAAPAAAELLDRLVLDEPQRAPEILAARARIHADAGDAPGAVVILDRAELQYPDCVDLRYAKAAIDEDQGRVAVALSELQAVFKSRPDDPAALNAFGYTLADNRQKLGFARELIERAHGAAPQSAAIRDSLGWVLFRQGHGEQALPYLTAAYADDRSGDIAAHLGEVLWQLGRQVDAERVWSEASGIDGANHLLRSTRQRLHASN